MGWPTRQRRSASRRTVCLSVFTSLLLSSPAGKLISLDDGGVGVGGEGIINEERGASERIMREERGNHVREGEKKSAREREGDRGGKYASGRHLVPSSSEREEGPGARRDFLIKDASCRAWIIPISRETASLYKDGGPAKLHYNSAYHFRP